MVNLQISQIWSISADRINAFFQQQNDVLQNEDTCYSCGNCEIRITVLPRRNVGRFSFPQTQVDFNGPEQDAVAIHQRFVLQFISAGG